MEYRRARIVGKTSLSELASRIMIHKDAGLMSALGEAAGMKITGALTRFSSNFDPLNIVKMLTFKSPALVAAAGRLTNRSNRDISYFTDGRIDTGRRTGLWNPKGREAKARPGELQGEENAPPASKNDGVYHTKIGPGKIRPLKMGDGIADILAKTYNLSKYIFDYNVKKGEIEDQFDEEKAAENKKKLEELFGDKKEKTIIKDEPKKEESNFWKKLLVGGGALAGLVYVFKDQIVKFLETIGKILEPVFNEFKKFLDPYITEFKDDWAMYMSDLKTAIVDGIIEGVSSIVSSLGNKAKKKLIDVGANALGPLGSFFRKQFEPEAEVGSNTSDRKISNRSSGNIKGPGLQSSPKSQEALEFFKSKGWSEKQAAGIVGNLQAESYERLNPGAQGDSGQAYGIAQWHPPRQEDFKRLYGKPIQQSTFREQLEFVDWELNNTEKKAGNSLRRQSTVAGASNVIMHEYERPSERSKRESGSTRIAYGNKLLEDQPNKLSMKDNITPVNARYHAADKENISAKSTGQGGTVNVVTTNNNSGGGGNAAGQPSGVSGAISVRNDESSMRLAQMKYSMLATV